MSCITPPRKVEYNRPVPVLFSFATNASDVPLKVVSNAVAVVGKSADRVSPVTNASPAGLTKIEYDDHGSSELEPPRYVEYTRPPPVELSLVMKTSAQQPLYEVSNAPAVVGKFTDPVVPMM